MLPVLERTLLQPGQRIVRAQGLPAACGKSLWRDTHTASWMWMYPGGAAAPGEPGSEQDYPEGLQHTEGSVLELGKAQEEAAAALE